MLPVVRATDAAVEAVRRLVRLHGELIFVISAGCCDGSAPMCFPAGDFLVGTYDIEVGTVAGCPLYVERRQLDAWPHAEIVLDVEPGYADGFSLAAGEGQHFVAVTSSCRTTPSDR
jgi:uncharacterized protein (DUF779 family)